MDKKRVLFVCTHNSARSQMAEALLRQYGRDRFEALSAGTHPTEVRPEAMAVMAEIGIDISGQRSKALGWYLGERFDWVITVCDRAREECPVFPSADKGAHWSFDDPSASEGSEQERLAVFRRVRDEIATRMRLFALAAGRQDLPMPEPAVLGQ